MQRVFVYGTLKQGFRNHHVISGKRLAGEFLTVEAFPLVVIGEFGLPWLVHQPGSGHRVSGQVFEVDDDGLASMDVLERVRDPGWYTRRALRVAGSAGGEPFDAMAYFGDAARLTDWTIHAGPIDRYTEAHQQLYRRHL
jgi:gamma-glutamylaminecyclotransferase